MTYEQEENIMGWMIFAMGILFIVAVVIAMKTPPTPPNPPTQDAPCTHSH